MGRGKKKHESIEGRGELPKKPSGIGRNKEVIAVRNMTLFYRYYYYSRLQKIKYDDVLEVLSSEFYLTANTVGILIGKNISKIKEITDENLTVKKLSRKFPLLAWKEAVKENRQTKVVFYS